MRSQVSSLQKERNNLLETTSRQRNQARNELLKNLNPIIKSYMQEKKIRMVIDKKSILLADEPTASLNREMADSLIDDLISYVKAEGQTLITVSHDINLLSQMDRTLELKGGNITNSTKVKAL